MRKVQIPKTHKSIVRASFDVSEKCIQLQQEGICEEVIPVIKTYLLKNIYILRQLSHRKLELHWYLYRVNTLCHCIRNDVFYQGFF